jgi:hypothetical protein
VVSDEEMYVYGIMTSLKDHGAIAAKKISVGINKTATDAGDLVIGAGHRLSGRLTLDDSKPIPAGTRLLVSRENAWDTQVVEVDANGGFVTDGLPTEVYSVTVRLRGYRLSDKNRSLDRMNGLSLKGLIDRDVAGINILMVSGDPQFPNFAALSQEERNELGRSARELPKHLLRGAER